MACPITQGGHKQYLKTLIKRSQNRAIANFKMDFIVLKVLQPRLSMTVHVKCRHRSDAVPDRRPANSTKESPPKTDMISSQSSRHFGGWGGLRAVVSEEAG